MTHGQLDGSVASASSGCGGCGKFARIQIAVSVAVLPTEACLQLCPVFVTTDRTAAIARLFVGRQHAIAILVHGIEAIAHPFQILGQGNPTIAIGVHACQIVAHGVDLRMKRAWQQEDKRHGKQEEGRMKAHNARHGKDVVLCQSRPCLSSPEHLFMPELPEVETTRRGLEPHLLDRRITRAVLRRETLRWPIAPEIRQVLPGQTITGVRRRAKYLLFDTEAGSALCHLGMSGSLRVLPADTPVRAHDHVDIELDDGHLLRFNDPRRFGCWLWQAVGQCHPLLQGLGPEPLSPAFDGEYLFARSRGRSVAVKSFLMEAATVVGVGNIYAAEALFMAGIAPQREAGKISRARFVRLAESVKTVLADAIAQGGTTLKDFISPDGLPGYFVQSLKVYGRAGEPCVDCGARLATSRIGQRASVWCPRCQR